MQELIRQLTDMQGRKNLILCHNHADSDAIGSAYALATFVGADIGVPKDVAFHTTNLIDELGIQIVYAPDITQYDHVIVVDTADPVQLGDSLPHTFWLFDHHPENQLIQSAENVLHEVVPSTAQLVYRFLRAAGVRLDRKMALALAAGILTDTIHFHTGDSEAFHSFGELLELGDLSYNDVQAPYQVANRQDRGAIIDAALRAKKATFAGFHILVTEVEKNIPMFAGRALFDLGADVCVVGHQREAEVEIRMYMRQEIAKTIGVTASDILSKVPGMDSSKVWGYALFAGYSHEGDVQELLDQVLITFHDLL